MGICGSLHLLFFAVRLMLFPIETGAGYPIPYVPDFVLNPYWPTRLFGLLFTVIFHGWCGFGKSLSQDRCGFHVRRCDRRVFGLFPTRRLREMDGD